MQKKCPLPTRTPPPPPKEKSQKVSPQLYNKVNISILYRQFFELNFENVQKMSPLTVHVSQIK